MSTRSAADIEAWIRAYLAKELGVDEAAIDPETPFLALGVGSRQAVIMAGDLEDWLGVELEAAIAWEHPTARSLAGFLAGSA